MAVALITPAGIRLGHRGAGRDARFEIGSISKALTGLLLADAVERGEVSLETPLGDLLEVGDALAAITLGALATHRGGLPRVPAEAHPARRTWELVRRGRNPYREDLEGLLAQARTVRPRGHRAYYSNLGFRLLGHALGAAAGRPYAALVVERLAAPLGMTGVTVPAGPAELTATDLTGGRTARAPRPDHGDRPGLARHHRGRPGHHVAQRRHRGLPVVDGARPGRRSRRGGPERARPRRRRGRLRAAHGALGGRGDHRPEDDPGPS